MQVASFDQIAYLFQQRIAEMIWCSMATLDTRNRLRSRIVQPIWDGAEGWIATRRDSLKAQHIAHNSFVSLAYIGDNIHPVYADGTVEWADAAAIKQHVWDLARTAPEPLRYDLAPLYQSAGNPNFGVLKFTPWRIEIGDMFGQRQIWQPRA